MAIESPWLNAKEAADYSKKSVGTIIRALNDQSLKGHQVKPRGQWSLHREDVDAWIRGERGDVQPARITRGRRAS